MRPESHSQIPTPQNLWDFAHSDWRFSKFLYSLLPCKLDNTLWLKKTLPNIFDCNLRMPWPILIIFSNTWSTLIWPSIADRISHLTLEMLMHYLVLATACIIECTVVHSIVRMTQAYIGVLRKVGYRAPQPKSPIGIRSGISDYIGPGSTPEKF